MGALGRITHARARQIAAVRVPVQQLAELAVFGLFPVVIPLAMAAYLTGAWGAGLLVIDFHGLWYASRDVLHGHSPYLFHHDYSFPFVYPAPAAVLMIPFAALPWKLAVALFWLTSLAALWLALHLLGVRDWRCYGAMFATATAGWALEIGTLTPLLVLAAAAAWRYRDRPWMVALAIASAIGTKVFLWPLVVWLVATRRYRAVLLTGAATVVIMLGSWAVIGFEGLLDYPRRLGDLASVFQYTSFSVLALAKASGLSAVGARIVSMLVTAAALAFVFRAARRPGGDRRSFVAAVGASLVTSPIVWAHYFLLVFVPIAIARRRLSFLWVIPLAYWTLPHTAANGSIVVIVCGLAVTALVLVMSAGSSVMELRQARAPLEPSFRPKSRAYATGTAA